MQNCRPSPCRFSDCERPSEFYALDNRARFGHLCLPHWYGGIEREEQALYAGDPLGVFGEITKEHEWRLPEQDDRRQLADGCDAAQTCEGPRVPRMIHLSRPLRILDGGEPIGQGWLDVFVLDLPRAMRVCICLPDRAVGAEISESEVFRACSEIHAGALAVHVACDVSQTSDRVVSPGHVMVKTTPLTCDLVHIEIHRAGLLLAAAEIDRAVAVELIQLMQHCKAGREDLDDRDS